MSWLPITDLFSSARTMLSFPSCVDWWFFLRNQDKGNVPHCCQSPAWYRPVFQTWPWGLCPALLLTMVLLQGHFLQIMSMNFILFLNSVSLLLIILSWFCCSFLSICIHSLPASVPEFLESDTLCFISPWAVWLANLNYFISCPN